jgi:Holliday junction resolvasome RuvABC endonuclease subunit
MGRIKMIIAIDPDLKKSGVCILDNDGEIMILESMKICYLLNLIKVFDDATYALEDVNKVKTIYARNRRDNVAVGLKIAQSVGMVKGAATLIEDLITGITGNSPILAPVGLGKQFKNDAKLFKELTGYQGSTNEDKRDAYAIARWVWVNRERLVK